MGSKGHKNGPKDTAGATFPVSAGPNAKKRHKHGATKGKNGNSQPIDQIKKENKPAQIKQRKKDAVKSKQETMKGNAMKAIPQAPKKVQATAKKTKAQKKASRKAEERGEAKKFKNPKPNSAEKKQNKQLAEGRRKAAPKPKSEMTKGQQKAKSASKVVKVVAAEVDVETQKRKEELNLREQDIIPRSYPQFDQAKLHASQKATQKLEDRRLKAEAKADRAAARLARRLDRRERKEQLNKVENFNVLKPVFTGVSKKRSSSKSKAKSLSAQPSTSPESEDEEKSAADKDAQEATEVPKRNSSSTLAPAFSNTASPDGEAITSPPAIEEASDVTHSLPEPTENFTGIPAKRYSEARKYFDERNQLAGHMQTVTERLKQLSARHAWLETRLSDMRRPAKNSSNSS